MISPSPFPTDFSLSSGWNIWSEQRDQIQYRIQIKRKNQVQIECNSQKMYAEIDESMDIWVGWGTGRCTYTSPYFYFKSPNLCPPGSFGMLNLFSPVKRDCPHPFNRLRRGLSKLKKQWSRGVLWKGVFRNLAKFTVKHLCQSLFFNKFH